MFTGWFAGAMDQVASNLGYNIKTQAQQTQCAAEDGYDVGYFEVSPL